MPEEIPLPIPESALIDKVRDALRLYNRPALTVDRQDEAVVRTVSAWLDALVVLPPWAEPFDGPAFRLLVRFCIGLVRGEQTEDTDKPRRRSRKSATDSERE